MEARLDAKNEELDSLYQELEGIEDLSPEERKILSKARALLFIISEAEISVERLIRRVSQDFSSEALDTGEESIQDRRVSERLAQHQTDRASQQQKNVQEASLQQTKESLKQPQAQTAASLQAAETESRPHDSEAEPKSTGFLINPVTASAPQVVPVEVVASESKTEALPLATASEIKVAAPTSAQQASLTSGQLQPASGIPGLSSLDKGYLDAFFVPRDTTDIVQLLSEIEAKESDKKSERLFYEAIAIAMHSEVGEQISEEQTNAQAIVSELDHAGSPQAFAVQVLQVESMLDESANRERLRIAEDEHASEFSFLTGLKAAEFLKAIEGVPAEVAESKEKEEEVERLVLRSSFV